MPEREEGIAARNAAELWAAALWAGDAASQGLGMVIEAVAPGEARLAMAVEPRMLNGHGTCHGGFIFALADSAFAFACNSRGQATVAQTCTITYLHPVRAGERLVATAKEVALAGRSGLYDVHVTTEAGVVAEFRGQSRAVGVATLEPAP
jgi:acyl-CoA thioesterase